MTRAAGLAASIARPVRPLVDRVFPRGALLLSTLTLATYAMGLLRNKVFASAYGLGTELDAYLYAFFLPEIVFDVIAASGLTAPFVQIDQKDRTYWKLADDEYRARLERYVPQKDDKGKEKETAKRPKDFKGEKDFYFELKKAK